MIEGAAVLDFIFNLFFQDVIVEIENRRFRLFITSLVARLNFFELISHTEAAAFVFAK